MKWSTVAAAMVVAAAPLAFQAPASASHDEAKRDITLRGCVIPGEKKNTFAMTHVTELTPPGQSAMPEMAHGRRVVYWLKDLESLRPHAGHMVEVSGKLDKFKNSEIEMKKHHGELYVEFEGPGKDVKVPNSEISSAIGTGGRVAAGKNDIKTMLAVIDVKNVTKLSDNCTN